MTKVKTYNIVVKAPNNITLHYNHQDILVNEVSIDEFILNDVSQFEVDELFKAGIVLSVTNITKE